jgi:uracil-DNA glycosylase family 4
VDARQEDRENPFGMDVACERCPALCDTRDRVVHGYGDVGADFLFVGTAPDATADESGVPFAGQRAVHETLADLGLCPAPDAERPAVENAFLTHLARCRHPDRDPTETEVRNCEDYLTAEVRTINPELLVPVGERALRTLAVEYTTTPATEFSLPADNGASIRGRGFEIVPMVDPAEHPDAVGAFVDAFLELTDGDYRQTKGRRGR